MVLGRLFTACFIFHLSLSPPTQAADNDQEILNQLYLDIINSSPAAKSIRMDSMRTPGKTISHDQEIAPASGKIPDPVSERLKKEMEKIVKDAQLRHLDAVKFMQDAK